MLVLIWLGISELLGVLVEDIGNEEHTEVVLSVLKQPAGNSCRMQDVPTIGLRMEIRTWVTGKNSIEK